MPTETIEYEKYLSDDSFVFTLIGNRGIFAFCPEKIVLIRAQEADNNEEEDFEMKTAPKDRVELGEIREGEPPARFPIKDVEEREVDTETEIKLFVTNQTMHDYVVEPVEEVSRAWLQTLNGYLDEDEETKK